VLPVNAELQAQQDLLVPLASADLQDQLAQLANKV
jgi:hypothetical protein